MGLYQQRSRRIIQLSFEMVKRKGKFPKNKAILENIPGIGQYIANAIMLLIHKEPFPLLDINMTRILERYFKPRTLSDIRDDPYLQQLSKEIVKHTKAKELNWAIIDYAALICKIRNPLCQECIIKKKCTLFNS